MNYEIREITKEERLSMIVSFIEDLSDIEKELVIWLSITASEIMKSIKRAE